MNRHVETVVALLSVGFVAFGAYQWGAADERQKQKEKEQTIAAFVKERTKERASEWVKEKAVRIITN